MTIDALRAARARNDRMALDAMRMERTLDAVGLTAEAAEWRHRAAEFDGRAERYHERVLLLEECAATVE